MGPIQGNRPHAARAWLSKGAAGAVRELTNGAFGKALANLRKYRGQLERGARLLLEKETLAREDLPPLEELKPAVAAAAKVTI